MSNPRIIFLSDVHVGVDAPTNWYQRALHEPYLLAILDYVGVQAASVAELVILGDLVDQWTYLPDVEPPSLAEIAGANPALFGAGGTFARLVEALPGRVTYVPGNHDMAVTAAELPVLLGDAARSVRLVTDPIYAPEAGRGRVACTHGHMYSPFNLPDFSADPRGGLPFGHIVTRLTTLYAVQKLEPGKTVADLPLSGDPTGTALLADAVRSVVHAFVGGDVSLSHMMLEVFLDAVRAGPDLEIVMADGSRTTAGAAADAYRNTIERWKDETRFPRALYGRDPGLVALLEVDMRNDLSHFAGLLGATYDVVVMGHTHAPFDDTEHPLLLKQRSLYANTGFGCPSRPDLERAPSPAHVTFTEVEVRPDGFAVGVRHVASAGGSVRVVDEPLWPSKFIQARAGAPAAGIKQGGG